MKLDRRMLKKKKRKKLPWANESVFPCPQRYSWRLHSWQAILNPVDIIIAQLIAIWTIIYYPPACFICYFIYSTNTYRASTLCQVEMLGLCTVNKTRKFLQNLPSGGRGEAQTNGRKLTQFQIMAGLWRKQLGSWPGDWVDRGDACFR